MCVSLWSGPFCSGSEVCGFLFSVELYDWELLCLLFGFSQGVNVGGIILTPFAFEPNLLLDIFLEPGSFDPYSLGQTAACFKGHHWEAEQDLGWDMVGQP